MIPKDCKRLAEVDFPIAEVSRHAARENRQEHPSKLHLWWARRPLASSRAVLLGLLWPDPCDPLCPEGFKKAARELLPQVQGKVGPADEDVRKSLLKFIADFANWDLAANRSYLEVSRALVKAAHGEEPPLVVDPFAGGGSIPLEALRLGCDAFASDLNPVACLILKVMLEDIPRQGPKLAEELRRVGGEIRKQVEKELTGLYPKDPDGAVPIAYLWARTVRCESPNCGAEIPLVRSFWLCKKAGRKWALRHRVVRPAGEPPRVEFEVFQPEAEKEVPGGTVTRAKATCIACGAVLPPDRVRAQLTVQRGGADVIFDAKGQRSGGARMLAVVTVRRGEQVRNYRLPSERDSEAVRAAQDRLGAMLRDWEQGGSNGICPVPDEKVVQERVSKNSPFRMHLYGCSTFGDLCSARQKLSLALVQDKIRSVRCGDQARRLLGLALGDCIRHWSAFSKWHRGSETVAGTFALQAISMAWDYPEMCPLAPYAGGFDDGLEDAIRITSSLGASVQRAGQVERVDAAAHTLPDMTADCWFTDPPYYDAIPYADLSDVFYVWHKRTLTAEPLLGGAAGEPDNPLTPKLLEIVQDDNREAGGRPKDHHFFEDAISAAFAEGKRELVREGIGCVVFAHKSTEGWEALLQGLIRPGWIVTSSWPVGTERGARLRARESAALATSVHLICRPRPDEAPVGDWADVLHELPPRVGDWMERLQSEAFVAPTLSSPASGRARDLQPLRQGRDR